MIQLFGTLIVIGLLLWAVNKIIPMEANIKNIVNVLVLVFVVLWLLNGFGLLGGFPARWR
jgi:hypothetical protein